MPTYQSTPAQKVIPMLTPGNPSYAFGSLNTLVPTTLMQVTNVALTSNVATLTVQVREGNIPAVGSLITVRGTSNSSGAFNVSNVALASVSITASTGIGTVTFALTHADVGSAAAAGQAFVPVPEVAESLVQGTKSQAFAIQNVLGKGYGISWAYTCPSVPSTISIQLEGAINDNDSEYTLIGVAQTTTSGYNEFFASVPELVNFVRLNPTVVTGGTLPTIVGKLLLS